MSQQVMVITAIYVDECLVICNPQLLEKCKKMLTGEYEKLDQGLVQFVLPS